VAANGGSLVTDVDPSTDSDGDGLPDVLEIATGSDPGNSSDPNVSGAASIDDYAEALGLEDEVNGPDSDGDGINDDVELANGSNPFQSEDPVSWVTVEESEVDDTFTLNANLGGSQTPAPEVEWDLPEGFDLDTSSSLDDPAVNIVSTDLDPGAYVVSAEVTRPTPNGDVTSVVEYVVFVDEDGNVRIDDDSDGVSNGNDNLDGNTAFEEVIQVQKANNVDYLASTEDGLHLRLGTVARGAANDAITVSLADIQAYGDNGSAYDSLAEVEDDSEFIVHGIYDYEIVEISSVGATVDIVIPLNDSLPADIAIRKFANDEWSDFDTSNGDVVKSAAGSPGTCPAIGNAAYGDLTEGHNCIQITITDGGANDADGVANGQIVDPVSINSTTVAAAGRVRVGLEGGSLSMMTLILSFMLLVRRFAAGVSIRARTVAKLVSVIALVFFGLALSGTASATVYFGAGIGQSELQPNTDGTTFSVEDDSDTAGQLFLGKDFRNWLGAEVYYMDQGSSQLSNDAEIGYQAYGVNALLYWPGNTDTWSIYGKLGFSDLKYDESNVQIDIESSAHLSSGVGVQWNFTKTWATRLDYLVVDKDSKALTLNLLKRFGGSSSSEESSENVAKKDNAYISSEALINSEALASCATDSAPNSPACIAEIKKVKEFSKVYFDSNSSFISTEGVATLDALAETMKNCPEMNLTIHAYTDSVGKSEYNKYLSGKRARKAKDYLINQGISKWRLDYLGFGEQSPQASDDTEEGRALNRRIEFVVE